MKLNKIRPVIVSSFGPPSLACIRSWGRLGMAVGMVCIRSEKEATPRSRFLKEWITLPPQALYSDEGIHFITRFLRQFRATGISSINEVISYWVHRSAHLLPEGVEVWMPDNRMIDALASKYAQTVAAREVGFEVLPFYQITADTLSSIDIQSDHFPLCLRPDQAGSTVPNFKVYVVGSREELEKFVYGLKKIHRPVIAQPFRNLPNLVVHGARTRGGDSIRLESFLVTRKFEGVTLTIIPVRMPDGLNEKCRRFVDYFDIIGNYHFEFLYDPGKSPCYFLEINHRFGGTTAKVYPFGYNEPAALLESYGIPVPGPRKLLTRPVSNKVALIKYLLYAVTNRLTPLDYPEEPFHRRLIKSVFAMVCYRDDIIDWGDVQGSFSLYYGNLSSKWRRDR